MSGDRGIPEFGGLVQLLRFPEVATFPTLLDGEAEHPTDHRELAKVRQALLSFVLGHPSLREAGLGIGVAGGMGETVL